MRRGSLTGGVGHGMPASASTSRPASISQAKPASRSANQPTHGRTHGGHRGTRLSPLPERRGACTSGGAGGSGRGSLTVASPLLAHAHSPPLLTGARTRGTGACD